MTRLGMILSAGLVLALWFGSGVSAQYPPPADLAIVSVSNPTPSTNSTVTITWQLPSPQGALPPGDTSPQRLFAISLQTPTGAHACVPSIATQPGNDARLTVRNDPADPTTGRADLFTGSTPGAIVVRIACPQGATAQVTVMVQGGGTTLPPPASAPPAGAGPSSAGPSSAGAASTPRPPSTGFGGQADESESGLLILAALASASAVAVSVMVLARRRTTRNG